MAFCAAALEATRVADRTATLIRISMNPPINRRPCRIGRCRDTIRCLIAHLQKQPAVPTPPTDSGSWLVQGQYGGKHSKSDERRDLAEVPAATTLRLPGPEQ